MSSNVLVKVRIDTGNHMVYECQPHQISNSNHVRQHGKPLFIKSCDTWHHAIGAGVLDKGGEQHRALDAMPIDFDDIPGVTWAIEVTGQGGEIDFHQFGSIAEAIHLRDVCHPGVTPDKVRISRVGAAKPQSRHGF